jgi:hypothetical protein
MRKIIFLLLITIPYLSQCQPSSSSLPNWVNNPPKSKDKVYGVGMGSSSNADVAERKANLDASVNLAKQIEPTITSVTSRIDSVVRGKKVLVERVSIVRKTVTATLSNTSVIDKYSFEENGTYTVYVLMETPKKEITRSVVNEINKDKELYSAIAKTKEYKQLVKEAK